MNNRAKLFYNLFILLIFILIFLKPHLKAQKIEYQGRVKIVQNKSPGVWGNKPKINLVFVRTIGELEATDENFAFYFPSDMAVDALGNLYILDSGNHRLQKFSPEASYLATFGRKGQGPGEFYFPRSLDIDEKGNLYISDPQNKRIQVLDPEGKIIQTIPLLKEGIEVIRCLPGGKIAAKTGGLFFLGEAEEKKELPKLIKIMDSAGKIEREIGEGRDYGSFLLNRMANNVHFATDRNGYIYLAFTYQNLIEKYSPDGQKIWQATRELNYRTEPKDKGMMEKKGATISVRGPQLNQVSPGLAIDDQNRIWVVTFRRQLKKEEQVSLMVGMAMEAGERTMTMKAQGNTDRRETDAYQLEIYDSEGILLGVIPLTHFVDGIRISGNRLFLLDELRGNQVYEYRIEEKR